MTIAITIKVNDGLVVAADSATTLTFTKGGGVANVYNNANKIANLHKGLPIGVATWGAGNLGKASMSTVFKDLRRRLNGTDTVANEPEWLLDPADYTIEGVAQLAYRFLLDGLYKDAYGYTAKSPVVGFWIMGYSAGVALSDLYEIGFREGKPYGPDQVRPLDSTGVSWQGQPEALIRLVLGFGSNLPAILADNLGVPKDQIPAAMQIIRQGLEKPLTDPAMPIQDAIDLARCLAELACDYSRFTYGDATIGRPVEVAAITKHEGFKWVARKHYYTVMLNPEE